MLGVTGFGLIFTPLFYVVIRGLFSRPTKPSEIGVGSELSAKPAE
jgi:hypothetical protein